ncbi:uncharacterized protein L203_102568 [Cryptococcus depauperatus CBS 7841]|uniref:Uncharacterized protein n=1 Tax=Cryptococcus depauperatus CBS 7841 TaxID=1295531 RepID=A0A1E3IDI1_9TREE|nr:hypothetical protein L203_03930 [Cryptococcus depauperatus CBS 7841]
MPSDTSENTPDTINNLNRRYQDEDADIILVASDGLRFRVHSYQLRAHSSVFRSMLELCDSSHEIILTDDDIEASDIVCLYLDLSMGHEPDLEATGMVQLGIRCRRLGDFLAKYDAASAKQTFIYALYRWVELEIVSSERVFVVAARMDNRDLCIAALKKGLSWEWKNVASSDEETQAGYAGHSIFDLSAAPLWMIKLTPPTYTLALMRQCRKIGKGMSNEVKNGVIQGFRIELDLLKEGTGGDSSKGIDI